MMSYMVYNVLNPIVIHSKDKTEKLSKEREVSRYSIVEFNIVDENHQN